MTAPLEITEHGWTYVLIKGTIIKQHQAAFMTMFILEADQFILVHLLQDTEDVETPKDNVTLHVANPSLQGYFTHLENRTQTVISFTWQDLYDMRLATCHPTCLMLGDRSMKYECHDHSLDTGKCCGIRLNIYWCEAKASSAQFKNIKDAFACYQHDDSDTSNDTVLRIFDGKQSIRHKFPITILPKDDSLPFLVSRVIFKLAEGEIVPTETPLLMFSDFYSSDDYTLSKITEPTSARKLIQESIADGPGRVLQSVEGAKIIDFLGISLEFVLCGHQCIPAIGKHLCALVLLRSHSSFTSDSTALDRSRYQHDDSETLEDIVIFSATDGFNTADGVLRVQIMWMSSKLQSCSRDCRQGWTETPLQAWLDVSFFSSLQRLCAGLMLLYMHDDTESLEDSFTVQLTDGKHTVQGTLYIYIMPVNDEIPHLSSPSEASFISQISFMCSQSMEQIEQRERNVPVLPFSTNPWSWECALLLLRAMNLTRSFTKTREAEGQHKKKIMCTYVVKLSVPVPWEQICDIVLLTKPVTLTEGDRVTLTTDVPVATDGTSKPEKLLYAVSLPPVHGQIEHINYPGVPISSYSQLDVVAQKVSDVHDNSHGAGAPLLHSWSFASVYKLHRCGSIPNPLQNSS
ncbi:LOW QUALITY PROTEIN: uncharacterized protein LJ206_008261 [Theristicus caerulescens]